MLLNWSKHPQIPEDTIPLSNFAIDFASCSSEQLVTITKLPRELPKSLIVSVFPTPEGPTKLPPHWSFLIAYDNPI